MKIQNYWSYKNVQESRYTFFRISLITQYVLSVKWSEGSEPSYSKIAFYSLFDVTIQIFNQNESHNSNPEVYYFYWNDFSCAIWIFKWKSRYILSKSELHSRKPLIGSSFLHY